MMPVLSPSSSLQALLKEHPFLVDFLPTINPKFGMLKNPALRAAAARFATLEKVAGMGGLPVEQLLEAITGEIRRRTGADPEGSSPGTPARSRGNGAENRDPSDLRSEKASALKSILEDLHDGLPPQEARARFNEVVRDVSPQEIGAMEEELIREGTPVEEIQRLCDLHVSLVKDSLERQEAIQAPPGHPVHTYLAANEVITREANRLGALSAAGGTDGPRTGWMEEMAEVLQRIRGIHNHYLRKENELFPVLERHGITGPSQVMWGVHDEIRGTLKEAQAAVEQGLPEAADAAAKLARSVVEMVYKENKILLPLALETLSPAEWVEVRKGEDELGYAFAAPAAPFPSPPAEGKREMSLPVVSATPATPLPDGEGAYLDLGTGRLSLEQVDMILRHLPVDLSFVDADGVVRYYSETPDRLFPRTPGAIGRHVTNCHPPKSVHMVEEILRAFSTGERDVAEFWIEMNGRFIHIRYFAVRNTGGEYLGCLEVSQDVTGIRSLQGERRLLEWT